MSDLIRREDAIDALKKIMFTHLFECGEYIGEDTREFNIMNAEKALDVIENLPSAEPEQKKGKWIVTSEFEDCRYVKCDQCKVTQVFYYNKPLTNFCPNCGAEMKRGE